MVARVVGQRDRPGLAIALAGLAAGSLALVAADDLFFKMRLVPLRVDATGFAVIATLYALAALAPLLRLRAPTRVVRVRCEPGVVRLGRDEVRAEDVTGLSVARASRGYSVAVARGARVLFLELEKEEDVARLGRALDVEPSREPLALRAPRAELGVAQALVSVGVAITGAGHLGSAMGALARDLKAPFGITCILLCQLSFAVLVLRRFVLSPVEAARAATAEPNEAHAALHAAPDGRLPDPAEQEGRLRVLARADEATSTWLARLDAIPSEGGVYRGEAVTREVLWETLTDELAPADARMAAARLLRRRHGEEATEVLRVVEDPDVRARVDAAMTAIEDPEEAAERIDELGPIFRAR